MKTKITKFVAPVSAAAASVLLMSAAAVRDYDDPELYSERHQKKVAIAPECETASIKLVYVGEYITTGYDNCIECCGKTDGITASGTVATVGRTCASSAFPFGTILQIDGLGAYIVEDCGPVSHSVIDIFCADHDQCHQITGTRKVWAVMG